MVLRPRIKNSIGNKVFHQLLISLLSYQRIIIKIDRLELQILYELTESYTTKAFNQHFKKSET
jgi:hypothetical protein